MADRDPMTNPLTPSLVGEAIERLKLLAAACDPSCEFTADVCALLDEVERLRAENKALERVAGQHNLICDREEATEAKLEAAESKLSALQARGEKMAGALEPFAEHAADYDEDVPDDSATWPTFAVGEFRRAADALAAWASEGSKT